MAAKSRKKRKEKHDCLFFFVHLVLFAANPDFTGVVPPGVLPVFRSWVTIVFASAVDRCLPARSVGRY
jgi:hypothetical protein